VSRMTKKQVSKAIAEADGAAAGLARAERARRRAQQASQSLRARQVAAQAQLAPLAAGARMSAQQGLYGARVWTAPRLDQMGRALEAELAPRMSAMMSAAARRIDPAPPPRRRWPVLAAGIVMIVGGSAAAVLVLSRRSQGQAAEPCPPAQTSGAPDGQREMAGADAAGADANGQMQAP
jgi:hypothetical protein